MVELLVTIAMLTFIVLGLLAMFNQTQRAFRSSITQTDVLEAGRAATGLIVRELEQASPSQVPDTGFGPTVSRVTNFFADIAPGFGTPLLQGLPGTTRGILGPQDRRTNFVQRFFFLTRVNQDWQGTGYVVVPDSANAGIGTLYRFSAAAPRRGPINLSGDFIRATLSPTNLNRIADGVVHFHVRTFAPNGFPVVGAVGYSNAFFLVDPSTNGYGIVTNAAVSLASSYPDQIAGCYFWGKAVPASVELEVGLLEDKTLARVRSIPNINNAQNQYLSNHTAQVHVFRQRIPIRNFDPTAYPFATP